MNVMTDLIENPVMIIKHNVLSSDSLWLLCDIYLGEILVYFRLTPNCSLFLSSQCLSLCPCLWSFQRVFGLFCSPFTAPALNSLMEVGKRRCIFQKNWKKNLSIQSSICSSLLYLSCLLNWWIPPHPTPWGINRFEILITLLKILKRY